MFSYILFDLDGTISDPKIGITSCVQYALKSFGINEPNLDRLEPFIGPPLRDSFMQYYHFSPQQAQDAIDKYRERFSTVGKFENELYPGMTELMRDLKAAGAHLAIASSKPGVYVEDILVHFGIRQYFEIVVGSELNGTREKKEEVLEEVMRRLSLVGAQNPDEIVMIGDRKFDVEGARHVGAHSIAVSYGYAPAGELEAAGADYLVHSVAELRAVLLRQDCRSDGQQTGWDQTCRTQADTPQAGWTRAYDTRGRSVHEDYAARYRAMQPKQESRFSQGMKAIGMCVLAIGAYLLVNAFTATVVVLAGMNLTDFQSIDGFSAEEFWLNMGNAAGILAAFIVCFAIWNRQLQIRPVRTIDGLSLIPMAILSASMAMGLNGAITLTELYKYSPAFQKVSELQTETPMWLGIIAFGILAPLGEELVFRGLVHGNLKKVFPVPAAILLSGLMFGVFHGNLVQGVYATILGWVFAWAYELYGTILIPMAMHGIANLFVYLLLNCTEFGAVFVTPLPCVFMLAAGIISLIMMVRWQKNEEPLGTPENSHDK